MTKSRRVSLFGHHHATDPTVMDRIGGIVHGIPVPVWVGVLGVLAAIAAPLVQHLVERSRDRTLAADEERKQNLDLRRTTARVRADLHARLRAHGAILRAALGRGEIDVDRWATAFDALAARSHDPIVIDALGPAFGPFATALHDETLALEAARAATVGKPIRLAPVTELESVLAGYEPVLAIIADVETPPPELETAVRRSR